MENKNIKIFINVTIILLVLALSFCKVDNDNSENGENNQEETSTELGFQVFPSDNPWNTDISNYPVHSNSENFVNSIGKETGLHPDFGTVWDGAPNGIPFRIVDENQKNVKISYTAYGDESDPGPFPIPDDFVVEGGNNSDGDRHIIIIDKTNKILYELYRAFKVSDGWEADSGAKWDLTSNDLRTKYWTSADAAGLPIFPGLVRYDEIEGGEINHALRFTVSRTQRGFISPARHFASSSTNSNLPPMGLRFRLKANFDISGFSNTNQIILKCLKKYGMIIADNGGDWFISGAPNDKWDDDDLSELKKIKGNNFEAIYTGEIEY